MRVMGRRLVTRTSRHGARSATHFSASEVIGLRSVSEATIYPHVFRNADREVGGVLVGRTPADGSLPMVTGAIPAISADERRATLTFTQDSWAHVHRTLDREFPTDEQIVGWYHSHPGFGIFLSGHDLFIHENFFGGSSQIAVVVDPCACREGAFVWSDGELTSLFERETPQGWSAEVKAPPVSVPPERNGQGARVAEIQPPRYPILALVMAGAIGVLLGLGFWEVARGGADSSSSSRPASSTARSVHRRHEARREGKPVTTSGIEVKE
jgi:proteasome lid subunit RPN8/RPN11